MLLDMEFGGCPWAVYGIPPFFTIAVRYKGNANRKRPSCWAG